MQIMGEQTCCSHHHHPPPVSVAPLLTIGMVTGRTLKIRRKKLHGYVAEEEGKSQQRAEAQGWSGRRQSLRNQVLGDSVIEGKKIQG